MKIESTHEIRPNHTDPTTGHLIIKTTIDGHTLQEIVAIGGPISVIEDYVEGHITWEEVSAEMSRASRLRHIHIY